MLKMEYIFFVGLTIMSLVKDSQGSCTGSGIVSEKVATMCTDSVVTGTNNVYIDTGLAGSMSLVSGIVCSCSVQTQAGKVISITSSFAGEPNSDCGTTVQFDTNGISGSLQNVTCNTNQFNVISHNMNIHFNKDNAPYESDYCIGIQLVYCNDKEFQCNDGACIYKEFLCDAFPNCNDHSDEANCGSGTCSEGQMLCNDGATCIQPAQICDGNDDCPEATDEPANCGGQTTSNMIQTTASTTQQIIVTCTESEYTPPTTTTTTTTTARTLPTLGTVIPTEPKDDDDTNNVIYIVVGAIAGLVVLIIATVAFIVYRHKQTQLNTIL